MARDDRDRDGRCDLWDPHGVRDHPDPLGGHAHGLADHRDPQGIETPQMGVLWQKRRRDGGWV